VIPSHNRTDLLAACLTSVARHGPPDTEVLVVDDGSPNGTTSAMAASFPSVRTLRRERAGGFCTAANAGLRAARGTVVELLNDDAEVTAGWAEAALACFEDAAVAAVAPLVLRWPGDGPDGPRIDSAGDRYYCGGVACKRGHGEPVGPAYLEPGPVFGASASSAFYRREAVLKVGGFPEEFGAYFEDVDLSFRLHWAGWEIVYEPESRVLHRSSASYGRPKGTLLERQALNEERVFWRNTPRGELLRALPIHLAVVAAKAWRRWREGNLGPFLRGRLRILGEIGKLLRHRQRLHDADPDADSARWGVEQRFWG
jgi:GT2 family glycosyltransferase